MTEATRSQVVVVGAGLAGLAAAAALAARGLSVTLLESRPRLGGRASSIVDRETGQTIDNCQHVAMGCCTNFLHFCETVGCRDLFEPQPALFFVGPPRTTATGESRPPAIVSFKAGPLPVPAHLALSFARMSWLTIGEKLRLGRALRKLAQRSVEADDEPFADWLQRQHQSPATIEYFWKVVLVSALSETLDRTSLTQARKVFVDGFLSNRSGWQVSIPRVPLDEIYGSRITSWLEQHNVTVRLKAGVERLVLDGDRISGLMLRTGETVAAEHVILAAPWYLVAELLPESLAQHESIQRLAKIETAPIASVHLWFDRPITDLPHAVLIDRLGQWLFNRSSPNTLRGVGFQPANQAEERQAGSLPHYYQVIISAAFDLASKSEAEVLAAIVRELADIWPACRDATLLHGRLITEHKAVFSPRPGIDELRPIQQTSVPNLQLAGDWTRTGWPSTMEGAVRSGYLAAENVLRQLDRTERLLQPDLPTTMLARWFRR